MIWYEISDNSVTLLLDHMDAKIDTALFNELSQE